MAVSIVGIDLAKNVFRLHGCDAQGRAVLRKQLMRGQLLAFLARLPRCVVAMESCASAHYWARELERFGHQVRLINPRFVKPFVKANKNDASDAEAICEAASRPRRCTSWRSKLLSSKRCRRFIECASSWSRVTRR